MAARKKAAPTDGWVFFVDGNDESWRIFKTYELALKAAKADIVDDEFHKNTVTVQFFQLAKVVEFTRTIVEVPVMTKQIKVEVK